jgi:molybdenum cofactor cytidylyltransferase
MRLAQALRFSLSTTLNPQTAIAFVGSGGKTIALFHLARELALSEVPVLVTATTHLHIDQIKLADSHWIVEKPEDFAGLEEDLRGVMLVTGPVDGDRTTGLNNGLIYRLRGVCNSHNLPMLIEADGSRQRPLKAPAGHEPVIPEFVETVVVVAGLTGLGKPLAKEVVYRPEIFARLGGLQMGETITPEALALVLTHPAGGIKNIPSQARRIVLLNQADTPALQALAKMISEQLLPSYHAVVAASLNPPSTIANQQSKIHAVYEHVSGIILAAGGSSRFGQPKPLLDWHGQPFVRTVAQTALAAGLSTVVVVTGANAERVETALNDLPVIIVRNEDWRSGQSSSIRAGLRSLPPPSLRDTSPKSFGFGQGWEGVGAAIFLLADQPQTMPAVLRALIEEHVRTLAPIIAPLVDGQRANPVLFDQLTFPDLIALSGDVGGRAVFSRYAITYLPWHDTGLLGDVDTPEDYRKLVNGE